MNDIFMHVQCYLFDSNAFVSLYTRILTDLTSEDMSLAFVSVINDSKIMYQSCL